MVFKFENVRLKHVSFVEADVIVKTSEIESSISQTLKRFDLPLDILQTLTGIFERRFLNLSEKPSDLAKKAALKVLDESTTPAKDIGIIINTSISRDYVEPAVAPIVHNKIGLSNRCINFDITNACLGFMNGIDLVASLIEQGRIKVGLVVNAENTRPAVENTIKILSSETCTMDLFKKNFATLTLGSGAAAMILCHKDYSPDSPVIEKSTWLSSTQAWNLCIAENMYEMNTQMEDLLSQGYDLLAQCFKESCEEMEWNGNSIDLVVTHQVSIQSLRKFTKLSQIKPESFYSIFPKYGNMGPASIPAVLAKAIENKIVNAGYTVGMLGVGSGLNTGIIKVTW